MPPKRSTRTRTTTEPSSRICSRCGRTESCAPGGVPPGWSLSVEAGRTVFLCLDCSRANIRAIEGKLPEEYWE